MTAELSLCDSMPLEQRADAFQREILKNIATATSGIITPDKFTQSQSLLDIGCGRGAFGLALKRMGHTGVRVGVDATRYDGEKTADYYTEYIPEPVDSEAVRQILGEHEFDMVFALGIPPTASRYIVDHNWQFKLKPGGAICIVSDVPLDRNQFKGLLHFRGQVTTGDDYIALYIPSFFDWKKTTYDTRKSHLFESALHTPRGSMGFVHADIQYLQKHSSIEYPGLVPLLSSYEETMYSIVETMTDPTDVLHQAMLSPSPMGNEQVVQYLAQVRYEFAKKKIPRETDSWDHPAVVHELRQELAAVSHQPYALVANEMIRYIEKMQTAIVEEIGERDWSTFAKKSFSPQSPAEAYGSIMQTLNRVKSYLTDGQAILSVDTLVPTSEKLDVLDVVKNVVGETQQTLPLGEHTLHITEGASFNLTADRRFLHNILYNLISNGVKYSFDDTQPIEVSITQKDNQCRITVRDHGIGMKEEEVALVSRFAPDYRTKDAHEHTQGTGFGLFLSAELAKKLGGTIEVKSAGKGQGSEFTLILPITYDS